MRPILMVLPLAAFIGIIGGRKPHMRTTEVLSPPPWCLDTTDSHAAAMQRVLRQLGTSSDSGWVVRRASLGLPVTPADSIVMLDDEVLCERASLAVDSQATTGPPAVGAVYLARFGNLYAVYPPSLQGGEWSGLVFFDSSFVFHGGLAW